MYHLQSQVTTFRLYSFEQKQLLKRAMIILCWRNSSWFSNTSSSPPTDYCKKCIDTNVLQDSIALPLISTKATRWTAYSSTPTVRRKRGSETSWQYQPRTVHKEDLAKPSRQNYSLRCLLLRVPLFDILDTAQCCCRCISSRAFGLLPFACCMLPALAVRYREDGCWSHHLVYLFFGISSSF